MSRFMSFFGAGIIRDDKEDMVSSEDDRLIPTSKVSLDLTDSGGKFTVVVGKIWGLMLILCSSTHGTVNATFKVRL